MPKLLNPQLDVVFKLIFAHPSCKNSLISLLTAVLNPSSPIEDLKVLNPEISKNMVAERGIVLDIHVALKDGRQIDVEMQIDKRTGWIPRILFNWSKVYGATIVRGDSFDDIAPCVGIFILAYEGLQKGRFHSTFHITDSVDHEKLTDHFELHVIELPNLLAKVAPEDDLLVLWARFLTAKTEKDLEDLAMKNENLAQASKRLTALSADRKAQILAQKREEALFFYNVEMNLARKQGVIEGKIEGRLEAERRAILDVLQCRGLSVSNELTDRLEACSDPVLLRQLLQQAISTSSSDDLLQELPPALP